MRQSYLKSEIEKNTYDLKKKMKSFFKLMSFFYANERRVASSKTMFIKKNVDRLEEAAKHIEAIDFGMGFENSDNKEQEIKRLCIATHKNLKSLEQILENKTKEDSRIIENKKYSNIKTNLDKVSRAIESFKRFDTSMNLSKKDWDQIDKRLEENYE